MSEIKELTSILPIVFNSQGEALIDWSVTGAAGGVGKETSNRLNYKPIADGELTNNVNPERSPDVFGYIYTNSGTGSAGAMNNYTSIPNGTPVGADYQRWYSITVPYNYYWHRINDYRTKLYRWCNWTGHLEAGTYKLIVECANPYEYALPQDNPDPTMTDSKGYYALIDENDNVLAEVLWDEFFDGSSSAPKWTRKETVFTVSQAVNVGVLSKMYTIRHEANTDVSWRFMIVPADTPVSQFSVTLPITGDPVISGVTCWEPFKITLPLSISSTGGGETKIEIDLGTQRLQAGQTVSLASTGISIPTYYGRNTITCDTDVQPTVYIKYTEQELVPMWAEERPAQVNIYDLHEPQSGFDHNGIAILMPSEVTSEKEDKGRWDITLTHPIDPFGKWTYIVGQNIVKVNKQLFRIDETEVVADADSEYITAHAWHITYDMRDYWIEEANFSARGGEQYITQLNAHRVKDFPNQQQVIGEYTFDITSDLEGQMDCALEDQSIIESIFGADNSLVTLYGGEVYRDNFHMSVNQTLEGAPDGNAFALRYGTDLTKISFKIDMSGWITNLIAVDNFGTMVAVWYDTSGDWIVHHHKTKRIHFTYSETDGDGIERLWKSVWPYWDSVSTPTISIVVEVANIKGDPKYKDFLNLQNYDVGYRGTIYVEHLGIDVEMKIVSIRRNELTGEAIQITLGNTRRSLIRQTVMSQTIVSPNSVEGKNVAATQSVQQELYNTQTALMSMSIAGMEAFSIAELERRTINELEGK